MKRTLESADQEASNVVKEIKKGLELIDAVAFDPSIFKSVHDFDKPFYEIIDTLINRTILDINGKLHRLAELEIYLNDTIHNDTFTHGDEQQKNPGQWYFHKMGKGFKGGSYKGLDITFSQSGYGGILIRAIMDIETKDYIDGPSLVVDHILSLTEAADIASLTTKSDFNWKLTEKSCLYLKPDTEKKLEYKPLYQSGRVGLVLRTDNHASFVLKPYRYLAYPNLCKKGKQHLILELYDSGKTKEEIQKITGATNASITGYIKSFEESRSEPKNAKDYYTQNTKLNANDFCKFYHVLRQEAKK